MDIDTSTNSLISKLKLIKSEDIENFSFSECIKLLEEISHEFEKNSTIELEESIAIIKVAKELYDKCRKYLDNTKLEIEEITNPDYK